MNQSNHKILSIFFFSFFLFGNVFSQTDSSTGSIKKSFFKFTANYLSNSVYSGRKDSATVPYLRSSIGYFDKSGFYISSGVALLVSANEPAQIDMVNIDAGYSFSVKKLDAGIYASKFFYSNASFAVQSELSGLVGFDAGYNLGIISLNAGGDLLFSTSTDINANIGLSHEFETGKENNKWTINPAAQLNAGTQYFNQAYYEFRKFTFATSNSGSGSNSSNGKGKGKGHSNTSNSGGTTTTTVKTLTFSDGNRFTILDYEFSVPVNYDAKHWGLFAVPVVAVPVNAASYAVDNVAKKEILSTSFFVQIGGYIKF